MLLQIAFMRYLIMQIVEHLQSARGTLLVQYATTMIAVGVMTHPRVSPPITHAVTLSMIVVWFLIMVFTLGGIYGLFLPLSLLLF